MLNGNIKAVATGLTAGLHIYLKTYSSVACNVKATHDECAVHCTRLGRKILNLKSNPKSNP